MASRQVDLRTLKIVIFLVKVYTAGARWSVLEQRLSSLLEWRDRETMRNPGALPDTERGGGLSNGGDRPVQVNKNSRDTFIPEVKPDLRSGRTRGAPWLAALTRC